MHGSGSAGSSTRGCWSGGRQGENLYENRTGISHRRPRLGSSVSVGVSGKLAHWPARPLFVMPVRLAVRLSARTMRLNHTPLCASDEDDGDRGQAAPLARGTSFQSCANPTCVRSLRAPPVADNALSMERLRVCCAVCGWMRGPSWRWGRTLETSTRERQRTSECSRAWKHTVGSRLTF